MTTTLNASTSGVGGFIATSDNSGSLALQTAGTTAITVDASQNVGIGLTSPTSKLDITGAISLNNVAIPSAGTARIYSRNTDSNLYIQTGSGNTAYLLDGSQNTMYAASPTLHSWQISNSEKARINSSGYFKASANGTYLSSSGSYHEFSGAGANGYELIITNTNASPASEYITDIRFTATTPNNGNAKFLACTDPTNEKAAILSNGGFLSRNNSYGTYSDIKLKENVVNASPKLADVMRLQVRNFNFKTNPEEKQIGFIAQEFEQVFPAMVDESQDRAQDGTVLDETTKSIKTSVLIPILVKAIQEQQALITAQAATINALTARIVALETA
jgi:hypothetical protein